MRSLTLLLALALPVFANGIVVPGVPRTPVRLTDHRVQARIDDRLAHVTVTQRFHNTTNRILEGTYLFPVPRGATLSNFAMTVGGKRMQGEVLDAERARAIYNEIVRQRRDPGLLEYCGRDLFRARVFPIPAKGDVAIEFTFDQLLPEENGVLEFAYPLATDGFNRAPVERVLVDLEYTGAMPLRSVYSPSHAIDVIRSKTRAARVTYERHGTRATKALLIHFGRAQSDIAFSVLSHRPVGEDGTFVAILGTDVLRKQSKAIPRDMIYVLDTSGSMSGQKLEQAQAALREAIGMLGEQDRFTLIAFSTTARAFRRTPAAVTDQARIEAGRWIRAREAKGGTAMSDALNMAVDIAATTKNGRLPIVVLLTDGKPSVGPRDAKTILDQVNERNRGGARIFTFGVGNDLDVKLLDRIAEATRGKRDYIAPHEEIGIVTRRFFRSISEPIATAVTLESPDGVHSVYPPHIGDLFAGDQIVVMGRYESPGTAVFRLRGQIGEEPFVREFRCELSKQPGRSGLPRLWAQRKVGYLADQIRLHGDSAELRAEGVRLGTKYAVVTPWTSGLVLEDGDSPLFYGSRNTARGPVPPGMRTPSDPPPPAAGPTGGPSKKVRSLKEDGRAHVTLYSRAVEGKSFQWNQKRGWIDAAWTEKLETKKIVAFSDEYFALLQRDVRIAKWLALHEQVTFVFEGVAYAIQPAEPSPSPAGQSPAK